MSETRKVILPVPIEIHTGYRTSLVPFAFPIRVDDDTVWKLAEQLGCDIREVSYRDTGPGFIVVTNGAEFLRFWHQNTGNILGCSPFKVKP